MFFSYFHQPVHHLVITATSSSSSGDASSSSSSSISVALTVLASNDHRPSFLPSDRYSFSVPHGVRRKALIGRVEAEDGDGGRNGVVR